MSETVDDIDALIEAALKRGECGPGREMCPNRFCSEPWHGLAITARMRQMRARGHVDDDYRYNTDTSTVLCPGSMFEGEYAAPEHAPDAVDGWDSAANMEALRLIQAMPREIVDLLFAGLGDVLAEIGEPPTLTTVRQWRAGDTETPPHYIEPHAQGEAA
jgi:hypothetical protein